jgi:L-cysteine/cystine lyase
MDVPSDAERTRVAALREQLPATESAIYLDAGGAGPVPTETLAAMRQLEDFEMRVGRGTPDARDELAGRLAEARAVVAAVLGTGVESVALTHSATEAMNVAAWAVDWHPGDEAVTTTLEHAGALAALAAVRDRFGVVVRMADVGDGGDDGRTLKAVEAAMTPRTRLVVASHVSWLTGAVLPVAAIGAIARGRRAWTAVDGAQAVGAIRVAVDDLGADFYGTSSYKWLLGPIGMGALYVSGRARADGYRTYAGASNDDWTANELPAHPSGDTRRFDSTGLNLPAVAGFARGAGWLAMHVGLPWAYERSARLARGTADELAVIPGVALVTPRARIATLVTFRIAGWTPEQVAEALQNRVHAAVATVEPIGAVRASIGWFNTEDELGRFVDAVAELAGQTPDSLPRRPGLTVLAE